MSTTTSTRDVIAEALAAKGGVLCDESESGSQYFELPGGLMVRVADHDANANTREWKQRLGASEIRTDKPGWRDQLQAIVGGERNARLDWLAERSSFIGSSESASICGMGYASESPFTIWLKKTGASDESLEDAEHLRWGRRLEAPICEELRERTGYDVVLSEPYRVYRSALYPFIGATPDAMIFGDPRGLGLAELKNVGQYNARDWQGDEPPLQYNIQIHHQMIATGATWGIVAGLVGGNKLAWHEVEFNARFGKALVAKLEEFWQCVLAHTPPAVDGSEATARAIAHLHPDDDGSVAKLPAEADQWIADIEGCKEKMKALESLQKEAENKLKAAIAGATFGMTPSGVRYSWKTQNRRGYVVQDGKCRVLRRVNTKGE